MSRSRRKTSYVFQLYLMISIHHISRVNEYQFQDAARKMNVYAKHRHIGRDGLFIGLAATAVTRPDTWSYRSHRIFGEDRSARLFIPKHSDTS